ncbi:Mrps18p [Saccharomyces cerevisiae x Saccharomyces kudriavzevii VIN7]|uniref:Small ribosomal subunit protein uS11m n=1 Tax=Saccharomyces cerevisiae x Saccharomyces kudriavzevii (strain VIN7) TaxID=1095631 RepID=H0GZV2_SACCK|nr:Mrps18p [Saccharomyces cerevisiae x Saccharomyces kudriavzevii VIN7]
MLLQPISKRCRWTPFAGPIKRWNSSTTNAGMQFSFKDISNQEEISNISYPSTSSSDSKAGSSGTEAYKPQEEVVKYILHGKFSKNNTHLTFSSVMEDKNFHKNKGLTYNDTMLYYLNLPQKVRISISTGCLGFRKAARGEYEAAFQTSSRMFELIKEKGMLSKDIEVVMDDFGKGRAAFISALVGKEGANVVKKVVKISDATKLKFGGVRSPKMRRL